VVRPRFLVTRRASVQGVAPRHRGAAARRVAGEGALGWAARVSREGPVALGQGSSWRAALRERSRGERIGGRGREQ
jgi:hypothetical protein